jgi:chromosome segregation ATPase
VYVSKTFFVLSLIRAKMQSTNTSNQGSSVTPPPAKPLTSRVASLLGLDGRRSSAAASEHGNAQSDFARITADYNEAIVAVGRITLERDRLQQRLDEVSQTNAQTVAALDDARRSLVDARRERDDARSERELLVRELSECRAANAVLTQTHAQTVSDLVSARRERDEVRNHREQLATRLDEQQSLLTRVTSERNSAMVQSLASAGQLVETTQQFEQARRDLAEMQTRFERGQQENTATINQLREQAAPSTVERLTVEVRQLTVDRATLQQEIERLRERDLSTSTVLDTVNHTNAQQEERLRSLNREVYDLRRNGERMILLESDYSRLQYVESGYIQLQRDHAQLSATNGQLQLDNGRLQSEKGKLEWELRQLRQTMPLYR